MRWFYFHEGKRIFVTPAILIALFLGIFPFFVGLYMSFSKISLVGGAEINFIGIENWVRLLYDQKFWKSFSVTALIVAIAVSVEYILGLLLAYFTTRIRGKNFFRVIFTTPMMLAPIGIGFMWRMVFAPGAGPVNDIIRKLGGTPIGWLAKPNTALFAIVLADVWNWTPFIFIILTAALQSLPQEPIEAAKVDGASTWQIFRYIIFPMIIPVSAIAIFLRAIEAFKIVDKIYVMTGGGPGIKTQSTTLYAYITGLRTFNLGYGSAIAFLFFFIILLVTIVCLTIIRKFGSAT